MTHPICPHCGYSLTPDRVVERDGWRIDPRGKATHASGFVTTRQPWVIILHALALMDGRPVSIDMLLSRASDSDYPNTITSQISQLRKTLREAGIPDPVLTSRRGGYSWVDAP